MTLPPDGQLTPHPCAALPERRASLYNVMERLEIGDTDGEEQPFIDDCLGAIAILEVALL